MAAFAFRRRHLLSLKVRREHCKSDFCCPKKNFNLRGAHFGGVSLVNTCMYSGKWRNSVLINDSFVVPVVALWCSCLCKIGKMLGFSLNAVYP